MFCLMCRVSVARQMDMCLMKADCGLGLEGMKMKLLLSCAGLACLVHMNIQLLSMFLSTLAGGVCRVSGVMFALVAGLLLNLLMLVML